MNNILEMIKNEKVEWKKLETLINYEQPTKYIVKSTQYDDKFDTPVLTAGQTFILGFTDELKNIYQADENNPVIIFDDFTAGNHWVDFNFKVKSSAMKILKPKEGVNFRYCYHYLKTIHVDISEHKRLWISKFSKIEIPIPSMETQERIVKILDTMVDHFTQLEAELEARNKQYEYYRDKLLSEEYLNKLTNKFGGEINFFDIKSLCKRNRGMKITAKQMNDLDNPDGEVKIFAAGNTIANVSIEDVGEDNIISEPSVIVKSRGNIDFDYYNKRFSHKNEMWSYTTLDKNVLNVKYLYYYLKNNLEYFKDKAVSGKLPQISTGITDNYKLPVPNIEVQNTIVDFLDRFQAIIQDVDGLLPKEIELRHKQYEYYRERLLDFKRDDNE